MQKAALLNQIAAALKATLRVQHDAALAAHTEATDETSRSENKYDTRGLEAGYLAQGQARHARELVEALKAYEALAPRDFAAGDPVDVSALVQLEADGKPATYFIGPTSGGLELAGAGGKIVVITPQSPLGLALMGKQAGQSWTTRIGGVPVKLRLVSVQ